MMRDDTERPILVVEHDDGLRSTVTRKLFERGYPVAAAANAPDALRILGCEHPSLIILDTNIPFLDGWGLVRELRERQDHFPTLLMTAASEPARMAEQIGAADYVGKPFDLGCLLQKVEQYRNR